MMCKTKDKTWKNKSQSCTKRSLVYEMWCLECDERENEKIKREADGDEKLEEELKKTKKIYKYIGETSLSILRGH